MFPSVKIKMKGLEVLEVGLLGSKFSFASTLFQTYTNASLMLAQRLRRWINIKTALAERDCWIKTNREIDKGIP